MSDIEQNPQIKQELEKKLLFQTNSEKGSQLNNIQQNILINTQEFIEMLKEYLEQEKNKEILIQKLQNKNEYQQRQQQQDQQENKELDKDYQALEIQEQQKIKQNLQEDDEEIEELLPENLITQDEIYEKMVQLKSFTQQYTDFILENQQNIDNLMRHRFQYSNIQPLTYDEIKRFSKFLNENYNEFQTSFNAQLKSQQLNYEFLKSNLMQQQQQIEEQQQQQKNQDDQQQLKQSSIKSIKSQKSQEIKSKLLDSRQQLNDEQLPDKDQDKQQEKQDIQDKEKEKQENQDNLKEDKILEKQENIIEKNKSQKEDHISQKQLESDLQNQKVKENFENNQINQQQQIQIQPINPMFFKTGLLNFQHVQQKTLKHFNEFHISEEDKISLPSQDFEGISQNFTESYQSRSSKASDFLDIKIQNQILKEKKMLSQQINKLKKQGEEIDEQQQQYCIHHNPFKNGIPIQNINQQDHLKKLTINKCKIAYFCKSCEELCCENCVSQGPHNSRLHNIQQIEIFKNQQKEELKKLIETNLQKKSESIYEQQEKLQKLQNEILNESSIIEKDIEIQFGGIFQRLGDSEGQKISILQNDITKLQRYVNDIDDFLSVFDQLAGDDGDQIKFLFMYKKLKQEQARLDAYKLNTQINQFPYDLPRELSQLKILLKEVESNNQIIKFRTEIIYQLHQQNKQQQEKLKLNQNQKFQKEFDYWIDLAERLNQNFLNKNLICFYCGELISNNSINGKCQKNTEYLLPPSIKGYTTSRPNKEFNGSKRHFFDQPIIQYRTPRLGKIQKLPNNDQIQSEVLFYNIIKSLAVTFRKLKRLLIETQINLSDEFKKLEKQEQEGYVSVIKFEYVLNSILGLDENETYNLTNFILDTKPFKKQEESQQQLQESNNQNHTYQYSNNQKQYGNSQSLNYNYGQSNRFNSNNTYSSNNNNNVYNAIKQEDENQESEEDKFNIKKKNDELINYQLFIELIDDQTSLEARAQKVMNVPRIQRVQDDYFINLVPQTLKEDIIEIQESDNENQGQKQKENQRNDIYGGYGRNTKQNYGYNNNQYGTGYGQNSSLRSYY